METNDRIVVDTFTGLVRYEAIPDKLDHRAALHGIAWCRSPESSFATGVNPGCPAECRPAVQFPDVTTWFQRLDATAAYTFDKAAVAQAGLKGVVKAKLHYAWERNAVNNWQNDPLAPINNVGEPTLIYLAYNNPNYNVHLLAASLAYTW